MTEEWTVDRLRAQVENAAVNAAIERSWCEVVDDILDEALPMGPLKDRWRNFEGDDTQGNRWRDEDGFDVNGFDESDRDRDGYDRDGRDKLGFDRRGLDSDGVSKDDPARFRYNVDGVDADGFYGSNGVVYRHFTRQMKAEWASTPEVFKYDRNGYDADGRNAQGRDVDGFALDEHGVDRDYSGYDRNGLNARGFNNLGYFGSKGSTERYDTHGFDYSGYWEGNQNWDPQGFNVAGIHRSTGRTREQEAELEAAERQLESAVIPG